MLHNDHAEEGKLLIKELQGSNVDKMFMISTRRWLKITEFISIQQQKCAKVSCYKDWRATNGGAKY